jgi:hypothetical protein
MGSALFKIDLLTDHEPNRRPKGAPQTQPRATPSGTVVDVASALKGRSNQSAPWGCPFRADWK